MIKAYYIENINKGRSKLIQQRLFELNYKWLEEPRETAKHIDTIFLIIYPHKKLIRHRDDSKFSRTNYMYHRLEFGDLYKPNLL